jgi:hypothetical protein
VAVDVAPENGGEIIAYKLGLDGEVTDTFYPDSYPAEYSWSWVYRPMRLKAINGEFQHWRVDPKAGPEYTSEENPIEFEMRKVNRATAHFAVLGPPPLPPDPDPEPEPDPPASGCQGTIEYKIGRAVIEWLEARGFEIREK